MVLMLPGCIFDSYFTKTKEVYVPMLYCPAPVVPTRPELPIEHMTPYQIQNDGEVAKHLKATIVILEDYALELEKSLKQVDQNHKAYDDLKQQLMQEIAKLKAEQELQQKQQTQ